MTRTNLSKAYPTLSQRELSRIEKAYYHHICDLLLEGIYNLYAKPQSIMKRYRFVNREVVNRYYQQGQSVVLMSAHYNNWEYMITSLNFQLMHHGVGVGKPLQDKAVASYITRRRGRYGTEIVDQFTVRQTMEYYHLHQVPVAYMMLSDQSPNDVHKSFWTMSPPCARSPARCRNTPSRRDTSRCSKRLSTVTLNTGSGLTAAGNAPVPKAWSCTPTPSSPQIPKNNKMTTTR